MQINRTVAHIKAPKPGSGSNMDAAMGAYTGAYGRGPAAVNINRTAQTPAPNTNGAGLDAAAPTGAGVIC